MKRTQIIELFSNIKATFMSFFAIMLFVILSVAVFAGISWTSPALQRAADEVSDEGNLYDIEVQFPNGLTEEDLQALRNIEGVDQLETSYTSLQMLQKDGKDYVTKVMALMDGINEPVNVEGNLPEKAGEIALNRRWAEAQGLRVGDTVTFKHDAGAKDPDGMTYLTEDTYTLTAIVDSPAYVSYNLSSYGFANIGSGYIQCLAFTAPESFDASAYPGHVQAYIRSDALRGLGTADAAYREKVQALSDAINDLGVNLAEERYQSILGQAQQQISEGEQKLADVKAQIEEAEQKIEDGKKALKEGKAEYQTQRQKLKDGYAKLSAGQQEYNDAKRKYDETAALYASMKGYRQKLADDTLSYDDIQEMNRQLNAFANDSDTKDLYDGDISKLNETLDFVNENVTEKTWNENKSTRDKYRKQALKEMDSALAEADAELKAAKTTLDAKNRQLQSGWKQYYDGKARLKEARQQIQDGEKELEEKSEELEESKRKYEEGVETLESYKKKLDLIKAYDWTVLSREYNGGLMIVGQYCDLTDNLRFSMAALFIIIGLLVSYSSISRIVRDQIVSIGTKKALGLRKKEITRSYLAYSGTAVLFGGILGLAAGTLGIEQILAKTIGANFIMGAYAPYFSPAQGAILIAVELALILLTTWMACRSVLKQQAVELLKGEKPPTAKPRFFESWGIWTRLPLLTKTVINNCINDRRRVFGTIIGIAGCTALIVTAVTVDNNIQKSFTWQYDQVYSYDTVIRYNAGVEGAKDDIQDVLDSLGTESTSVYAGPYKMMLPDGKLDAVTVTVPFEDDFDDFVHRNIAGKAAEEEYTDGIWVSVSYAAHFDAKAGDSLQLMDSEGQVHTFTIQGFYNHYLFNNQIIMSREAYQAGFDSESKANAFLVASGDNTAQQIRKALSDVKAVRMVKDDYQAAYDVFSDFADIAGAVVIVYLVLSVLMAVIVLFDLYSVFIEEKKRELIVLMINGFSVRNARQYIYRDTIVLTILGIVLGVIFGAVMGNVTILTLEPDMAYFAKCIDWPACGLGAATSAVLAFVLCSAALRRISKFKLSDINKL